MIIKVKPKFKDNPKGWGSELVSLPSFDVNGYQSQLNKIAGLSRSEPILKLTWGGNAVKHKYDRYVNGVATEIINEPEFSFDRHHPLLLDVQKIPIRRWIITQRTEPEQIGYGDESDNTYLGSDGVVKLLGIKPKSGYYTPYIYIGDHSTCHRDCCKRKLCYGDYKHPSQAELDLVAEHTYRLMQDNFNVNPYKRIDLDSIADATKELIDENEVEKEKHNNEFNLKSMDWFRTHGHRLKDDNPKEKYMFLNGNK